MKALPPLFDKAKRATGCQGYLACRDHYMKRGVRRALTRIWNKHGHLVAEAPAVFVAEFRRDFHARAWELIVLDYLVRAGATLQRAPTRGPDFRATLPDVGTFWVECVVPKEGTGPDAAPRRSPGQTSGALGSSDPVALRYANAIGGRVAKIRGYRSATIVGPDEPVLVALNQGAIDLSDLHDAECPLVVRVLFGLGKPVVLVNPYSGTSRGAAPRMPSLQKRSGANVSTRLFLEPESSPISGLLFASASVYELVATGRRRRRMRLVHNPKASAPFPVGVLPLRGEAWAATILEHAGVMSSFGPLAKRKRWPMRELKKPRRVAGK